MADTVTKDMKQPEPVYVANVNPASTAGVDHNGLTTGVWSAGLFSCCDSIVPNCCMSFCCPCFSLAQITSRLGLYGFYPTLIFFAILYVVTGVAESAKIIWLGGISWMVIFIALFALRSQFRKIFALPGSCCGDCCASFFCSCCTIAQMATHAKSYEKGSCQFGPPATLPGYKA